MEESKKDRIIKIIKISLLLGTIIFSIIFFIKSCKRVNAYSDLYKTSDTIDSLSINNVDHPQHVESARYDYFYLYDLIEQNNQYYNIAEYTYNGGPSIDDTIVNIAISNQNIGGNQFYIYYQKVDSDNHLTTRTLGPYDFNENDVLMSVSWVYYNDSWNDFQFNNYLVLLQYDSSEPNDYKEIASSNYTYIDRSIVNNNHVIDISLQNRYWVISRYTNYASSIQDVDWVDYGVYLLNQSSPANGGLVYRSKYLFGDLVSSFLNIQFGTFEVAGTTHALTMGMLLLFILGIGALFIVLKIMMGG